MLSLSLYSTNLFINLLPTTTTLEENQNNEQPQASTAASIQDNPDNTIPETSTTTPEVKEESPALPSQSQKPNISAEDLSKTNTEAPITNHQLQTAGMEVHKHPHHVMQKKNWGEYLLEFFMLFLAVTLGFFAENIREHYTEKTNAKRYLESYSNELLQQKKVFEEYKKLYQNKIIVADTIKNIFFNGEENKKIDVLERLLVRGLTLVEIPFNTSSYDQMVNSGALRYVNDIELRDSMSAYKGLIETTKAYNIRILQSTVNNTFEISKIMDFHDVISTDTSQSYDAVQHIPQMKPFAPLSQGERNSVVFFFESYIVQSQSDLRRLRRLESSNQNLLAIVHEQLEK